MNNVIEIDGQQLRQASDSLQACFSKALLVLMVSLVVNAALAVLEKFVAGYWQQASVLLGWVAQVVSQLGDWFNAVAVYALLLDLTGSGLEYKPGDALGVGQP